MTTRNGPTAFKAKVAIAAIREGLTVAALA